MKRERRFYVNAQGPYEELPGEDAAFGLFVERVEKIVSAEGKVFWSEQKSKLPSEKQA